MKSQIECQCYESDDNQCETPCAGCGHEHVLHFFWPEDLPELPNGAEDPDGGCDVDGCSCPQYRHPQIPRPLRGWSANAYITRIIELEQRLAESERKRREGERSRP